MGATVTVLGQATVPAKPDEGVIHLSLTAVEPDPQAATGDVAGRSEELGRLLDELGVPEAKRLTSGVRVHEEHDYDGRQRVLRGYRAHLQLAVRLTETDIIGPLIEESIKRVAASVSGPTWKVGLDNPARVEACSQAAAQAKVKAEAYARSLGMRLGSLVSVVESGVRHRRPEPEMEVRAAAFAELGDRPMRVDPGELDISATVEVTFQLEP